MIDPEDLPVVGMLLEDTPPAEIAEVIRVSREDLGPRVERIVGRLVSARE